MDRKHFLELAQRCSVKETKHTLHFINWQYKVFGANIMDYPNALEIYTKIKEGYS